MHAAHSLSSEDPDAEGQVGNASLSESQDSLQPSASIRPQEDGTVTVASDRRFRQGVSPANSPSDGTRAHWKQEICKKARDTWQGLHKIAKIIAPMVPVPFKGPLELFNAISDVAVVRLHPQHIPRTLTITHQKYIDNEEKLKDTMKQLSARLVEVNSLLLLESNNCDIGVNKSAQQLAEYVTIYAESTVSLTPLFAGWW